MDLDVVMRALAEPHRREILRLVRERELSAGDIASRLDDVSRPAISQHLRVLADAGLLLERRAGRRRYYRARRARITQLRRYLGLFWVDRLDALKIAAERRRERGIPVHPSTSLRSTGGAADTPTVRSSRNRR